MFRPRPPPPPAVSGVGGAAPVGRRTSRRALVAAPIFALAAAGAAWAYWTSTPSYAIRELATGFARHDTALVLRHLDVDATSSQVVGSLFDAAGTEAVRESRARGEAEAGLTALGAAMLGSLKPVAAQAVAGAIHDAVTRGTVDSARVAGVPAPARPFAALTRSLTGGAQRIAGLGASTTWGDSAAVDVKLREDGLDTTLVLPVLLRKTEGAWKVVGLRDVGPWLVALDALHARKLAAVNTPIRGRLAQMVRLGPLASEVRMTGWFSQSLRAGLTFENRHDKPLLALGVSSTRPVDGTPWTIRGQVHVLPNTRGTLARWVGAVNPFFPTHVELMRQPAAVPMQVDEALFDAGGRVDTVRVYPTWDSYVSSRSAGTRGI